MFLRSQLASRLPVTAFRYYRSSTSSSTLYLSRCHSHTTATSTPQLARHFGASLAWIRGNFHDWGNEEKVKGARTKHTDDSNSSSNKRRPEPTESEKRAGSGNPSNVPLAFSLALMAFWYWSVHQIPIPDGLIPADAPQVDYDTFVEKYLRAGEIQKISFIWSDGKAVATLHAGAIVDGEPAKSNSIVINCPNRSSYKFRRDVSKVEAEMGISLADRVDIEIPNLIPPWKKYVLFGGLAILPVMMMRDVHRVGMLRKAMK